MVTVPAGAQVLLVQTCTSSVLSETNAPALEVNLISASSSLSQPWRSVLIKEVILPSWRKTIRLVIKLISDKFPAADILVTVTPLYDPLSSVTGVSPIYIVSMSLAASPVIPEMLYAPPVVVAAARLS